VIRAALAILLCAQPASQEVGGARDAAAEAFRAQGIRLDLEHGLCSIPVTVLVRDDLLEYVLVNPHGAAHESLFVTEVDAAVLNAALVALGVEPGKNARWKPVEPAPSPDEVRAGADAWQVEVPRGDGFHLYVGWRDGEETFFYRLEDLMRNLETGRAMRRHRWVYLGSRFVRFRPGAEEVFAATFEGNLVNLSFFEQGNTLLTAALPECEKQTIWLPNAWLIPGSGERVDLVWSRERLDAPPPALVAGFPKLTAEGPASAGEGR